MDKFENAKDKVVGKVKETTGKLMNDQEMEFAGKFQQASTEVKDKFYEVKDDVFQEGNKVMDRVNEKLKGDNKNARNQ